MHVDGAYARALLDLPLHLGLEQRPFRRVGDAVPWQDFPIERLWEFEPNDPADGAGASTLVFVLAALLLLWRVERT
jgi:hypothetical protein